MDALTNKMSLPHLLIQLTSKASPNNSDIVLPNYLSLPTAKVNHFAILQVPKCLPYYVEYPHW